MNYDPASVGISLLTAPIDKYGGGGFIDTWQETLKHSDKWQAMDTAIRQELGIDPETVVDIADPQVVSTPRSNKLNIYRDCLRGASCHSYSNSFFDHSNPQDFERIDYIFYRPTTRMALDYARLAFVDLIPSKECSYSDHYGMKAVFSIPETSPPSPVSVQANPVTNPSLPQDNDISPLTKLISPPSSPWISDMETNAGDVLPLLSTVTNVSDSNLLPAIISLLTYGIRDARTRMRNHGILAAIFGTIWGSWAVFYIISLSLTGNDLSAAIDNPAGFEPFVDDTAQITLTWIWLTGGIITKMIVFLFGYSLLMQRFVLPDEVAALERIRSEVVVWVQGHAPWTDITPVPSSPMQLVSSMFPGRYIASDKTETALYVAERQGRLRKDCHVVIFHDWDSDAVLDHFVVERVLRIAGAWVGDVGSIGDTDTEKSGTMERLVQPSPGEIQQVFISIHSFIMMQLTVFCF
jgi:hypothetical protein